ncbi:flagellar basal-body MS-ring/collar protein FliF [Parahaliea mediterranea]|uniref:flagellar basal-body MS-ring/collar protein FliF n=1 Tax=Parahaliea mediterranea TaxID=651086 RepID=UPI000E2F0949|nr:flagellar basal-body MS-ring/collar protein FliF [Parahaliea mediterranea]
MSKGPSTAQSRPQQAGTATEAQPGLLEQLRSRPLIPLLLGGAAAIAVVTALLLWASAPNYRVLFSNLGEADGGRIISELEQRGVPYRFAAGGQALLVPEDQVHSLRLRLAEQGLPRGGNVGFEVLDNQAFGVSQFKEQVNFQRGLESQLAASIEALGPVSRARVHLALARPSVFVRDHQPAKASVVLTLQSGRALGEGAVNAIVHLVSSSVPELAAEDVTVVDQRGQLLSRTAADGSNLDGTQLDYIQEVERSYRQRIEHILTPLLGAANLRAQVAAQIDFASREETAERYAPNQGDNTAAVRSAQTSTAFSGSEQAARGVPGALSNTPPGAAPSPINYPDAATDDEGEAADARPDSLQRDDVINYELDRNVMHTQHQRGSVERLSVAVVVNYRESVDEDGNPVQLPLDDEQLQHITRLVRQAVGYSEARGDAIEVVNSPFTETRVPVVERQWWESSDMQQLILQLGRYLLVFLAALVLYFSLLRPLVKRYGESRHPVAEPPVAGPSFSATVGAADDEHSGDDTAAPVYEEPGGRRRKPSGYEQNLADLKEMAAEEPAIVAMIVRNWIAKYE